jgi:hypothetical protein
MNDKIILVDAIDAYLGSGKSVAQIARDIAVPNVGSGAHESDHRRRVRELFGNTEAGVQAFLNSLIGQAGTAGVLTATSNAGGTLYAVA